MKLLTNTWHQLVQRRLWPIALLLLGALVAVPFVLGKSPEPVAPAPAAPATANVKASAASADPIVTMVSDEDAPEARRSLGVRHNPFAPSAPKKKAKKSKGTSSADSAKPEQTSAGDPPASDAPASDGGGISAPTTPTAPAQPTETVPAQSIVVRFGSTSESDGDLPRKRLARDEALSSDDQPLLVYLGMKDGGKTAVFLVSEGLKATGDGKCAPSVTCEKLELKVGETEFFQFDGDPDATEWELDLVKIYKHATKVPATDESSSTGFGTGGGSTGTTGLG
jgi:hypothetical protein